VDLEETAAMAPTKDAQRLRRAAERKGKAEDQYQLAILLNTGGEGLKQDLVAAAKWLSKAAAQEHAYAQYGLGMCYYNGEGVDQNRALGATWVSKAADHGDVTAQGALGVLYHEGQGVEQNDSLAVAWLEKAAVGNDITSQFNLGLGYTRGGFGLTKNAHCAKIFMMAAADNGQRPRTGPQRSEGAACVRGMRHPGRQPRVPGLHVRDGPQHGSLLHPRVPEGALGGSQG